MTTHIQPALLAAATTAAVVTPDGSSWRDLGFAVLSAVLAAVLSWLTNRKKE